MTRISIRCSDETQVDWGEFAAGYDTYEDAILDVLNVHDSYPGLFNRQETHARPRSTQSSQSSTQQPPPSR